MGAARYIAIEGPLRVGKSSLARALADRIREADILTGILGSDHCPVGIQLAIPAEAA